MTAKSPIRRIPAISPDRLAAIKARVPLPSLVADSLPLQRAGRGEYLALCPFHAEDTPSFRIYPDHAHCFGCGWHGDQVAWLVDAERLGFLGAVHRLCNWAGVAEPLGTDLHLPRCVAEQEWQPIAPLPADAPALFTARGYTVRIFNPKRVSERGEWASWRPALIHPYRWQGGGLLGFVLRVIGKSGKKFTPTVTYCENSAGERRWCIVSFRRPLPLYNLDRLASRKEAAVVMVEGEKAADAAGRLLPAAVTTTWPGGSKAYQHVDFSPLWGRKVVCIPDADPPGREAFYGRRDHRGKPVAGILELLAGVGALARFADPEPDRPPGWDLADAEAEGWSAARARAWLNGRLAEVHHAP